jgi:hypothetical protein
MRDFEQCAVLILFIFGGFAASSMAAAVIVKKLDSMDWHYFLLFIGVGDMIRQ